MATKKENAATLEGKLGIEVNPDKFSAGVLETFVHLVGVEGSDLESLKTQIAAAQAPKTGGKREGMVLARVSASSNFGGVSVPQEGTHVVTLTRSESGYILSEDFERLREEYGLEIVEPEPVPEIPEA